MATIIPLSFKDNLEDKLLLAWLEDRFSEYNGKSNYIKYLSNSQSAANPK